jgi:magnesium-transporting ATPase (P-type)
MQDESVPESMPLTAEEVAQRQRAGRLNRLPRSNWRDYGQILSRNLFTLFNALVAPAALALFLLEEYRGAVAVSAMAVLNTVIGLAQETLAKRRLDRLTLLAEARVQAIRDGQVHQIPAGDVVRGDHLLVSAGAMIVADGPVLAARFLEVDEALLTGESEPVRRRPGDVLLSGSFCVAGEGTYQADRVGGAAHVNRTTAQARCYRYTTSPLGRVINLFVQVLSYTAVGLCVLHLGLYWLQQFSKTELVQMVAATITSMVPQGLVLTATVAFTLGAVRLSTRGAVVQRLQAVETMASVDVVCLDKTGTLTTNRLRVDGLYVLDGTLSEEEVRDRLRLFASAATDRQDKTLQALRFALGEEAVELLDQVPFKAQNRYSAVRVRDGSGEHVLVLGACEALRDHLDHSPSGDWEPAWAEWLRTGQRILMFAEAQPGTALAETLTGPMLRPLALVALSDELRPEAGAVLLKLAGEGIAFKILSGDHPETVRAAVRHLALPLARDPVVTSEQLETAADPTELIRSRSVFGRVSPDQKVRIVRTLQEQGHRVAMIGDGINDVLPIKWADLGIAMGAGSQASRSVAALVLAGNDFALLPETLEEGRIIVRNLRRCCKLFLVKNVYSLLLIPAGSLGLFGLPFPYLPQQVTLLDWLAIGIPAFVIALSRGPAAASRPDFLREVGGFALRTGAVFAFAGLVLLLLAVRVWPDDQEAQRTLLLSALIFLGGIALLRALRDGEPQSPGGDTRLRLLAILTVPVYLGVMYWPPAADFFRLHALTLPQWGWVLAVVTAAYGLCRWTDRGTRFARICQPSLGPASVRRRGTDLLPRK